jgi:protein-ribulosamine 3-kinase
MISSAVQQMVIGALRQATGTAVTAVQFSPVGGGSINQTFRVHTNTQAQYFCKLNSAKKFPGLFRCEQQGLELLGKQQVMRVPAVIACMETGEHQVLLLEWIEQGIKTEAFWRLFGKELAALHQVTSDQFGLNSNNYMGALPQHNHPSDNWCNFFATRRLEPQVRMAVDSGLLPTAYIPRFDNLYSKLPVIFPVEPPALLHGDLWSGNYLCDAQGRPVLIDPAVYYGHSSVDMAMTTLFGGFDEPFYEAYRYYRPLPANYREQWEIANLYPLLIHLNLFGAGYLADIVHTLRRF